MVAEGSLDLHAALSLARAFFSLFCFWLQYAARDEKEKKSQTTKASPLSAAPSQKYSGDMAGFPLSSRELRPVECLSSVGAYYLLVSKVRTGHWSVRQ